ncbi:hypothetical protein FTUN_4461 [Frigoriglobus tundricola]|uniref:Uncharacterized protein n=1 Tax=Frigoriglobus tundricola TaxID=2774151 RepID=A0A6M5YUH5_9BACT|nr:hypothetical protein FTUN_4461 [Frigoriglobus tundricola]
MPYEMPSTPSRCPRSSARRAGTASPRAPPGERASGSLRLKA